MILKARVCGRSGADREPPHGKGIRSFGEFPMKEEIFKVKWSIRKIKLERSKGGIGKGNEGKGKGRRAR